MVRDGRFGPYVTDGTTNASLRKGDSVETITTERAVELLAERRAKAPAAPKKQGARRRASTAPRAAKATKSVKATKSAKAGKATKGSKAGPGRGAPAAPET